MKKLFGLILTLALVITAVSGCSCSQEAPAKKPAVKTVAKKQEVKYKENNFVLSSDYNYYIGEKDMYSTLLFAKDRYVYSNKNGIYVKKDLRNGGRKITAWSNGAVLCDGETVYYLIVKSGSDSTYEYYIFSVGMDGKNEKKILSGIGPASLITIYNGNLYFRNSPDTSAEKDTHIMRYKLGSKKDPEMISLDYQVNYNCVYNGKIYFSNDKFSSPELISKKDVDYSVYSLDLETEDIKKVVEYSYGESIAAKDSKDAVFYSRKVGEKGKIFVIGKDNKITESKSFKTKIDPWFTDKTSENAYMCDFNKVNNEIFLKYNIKTAAHKKLSVSPKNYSCSGITSGLKPTDNVYIALTSEGKKLTKSVAVQKVVGNKTKYCKFNGKKSIETDLFWITDDKLILEVNNKMRVYNLK